MAMSSSGYREALYKVKRNFLIIGLTGYTGAGCSESRELLSGEGKPSLPNYEAVYKELESSTCDGITRDTGRCAKLKVTDRNKRIYDKLKRTWEGTDWNNFVPIKISAVILAFAMHKSIITESQRRLIVELKTLSEKYNINKDDLENLWAAKFSNVEANTTSIIEVYCKVVNAYKEFKAMHKRKTTEHSRIMQNFGDQIRKYGSILPKNPGVTPSPENLFLLPEAVRRIVKSYYWNKKRSAEGPFHFVIDAFRNPIEIEYFKWRYSEFYLVGVLRNEEERRASLDLGETQFAALRKREKGELFKGSKNKIQKLISSQNVYECLQKADMYIENVPGQGATFSSLKFNLIKLISLAKNPGCIPPTKDERNMQIAMTAKQMSGCISRQVGATLVSEEGYAIGIGWNDPPSGQTPCSLRTGSELVNGASPTVFSDYERGVKFVNHIRSSYNMNFPFCFRNELGELDNGKKKNEFTRALHAEENAMFQGLANSKGNMFGSTLYTTSRTCTLCAKKAYQLGISRICYIEEYTDIAIEQTLRVGERQINIDRFQGVVGAAFFRLFSSLIPEKDLIQLYYRGAI